MDIKDKWEIKFYPTEVGIHLSNCYSYSFDPTNKNNVIVIDEGITVLEAQQKIVKYYRETADWLESLNTSEFLRNMGRYDHE